MRTLFLLLLSCLPCFAQFGIEQPMFQLTSTAATSITNDGSLHFYLNFQDLTNGPIYTWTDRVSAVVFQQYAPPKGPSKNSSGAWFTNYADKSCILTNIPLPLVSNSVFGMIWKPILPASSYNCFLDVTNSAAEMWEYAQWSGSSGYLRWGDPGNAWTDQYFPGNQRTLISFAWSNSVIRCWTNGVFSKSFSTDATHWHAGIRMIGGSLPLFYLNNLQGSIQEIAIWTNIADARPYVSNYFNYATNTYTFP